MITVYSRYPDKWGRKGVYDTYRCNAQATHVEQCIDLGPCPEGVGFNYYCTKHASRISHLLRDDKP